MADADTPTKAPTAAIGYTHAPTFTWWLDENEQTPELQFPLSVRVFDQMRRTDSQVTSVLEAVCQPVERTPWRIDPNGARDEVVRFVADDFGLPIAGQTEVRTPLRMKGHFSWKAHLRLALLMLPYGFSYFEQLYRVEDDGSRAHLAKLEFRPQTTIDRVEVASDGGLVYVQQYWTATNRDPRPIPVDRLVAYVHRREGGNWLGMSILRPVYKNWLLKDRLLRVQAQTIERNGMGIPDYEAAETEVSLAAGLALATNLRAGEAAGISRPAGSKLRLLGVEGTLPDAKPAVEYHDQQIARAVLAHFLNLGTQTGSWALGSTFADFFTLSLQTLAQQIADTTTQYVIEDLVDVNWGPDEPAPRLCFDEIGSRQQATAEALKSLVDAGLLDPDEPLKGNIRQFYGLPPADPATATPPPGEPTGETPPAPTEMGEYSVAASADEASWIAAAAGIDMHPGGEELKHWWVFGEGAAKWATWTELYEHLRKYIENPSMLKKTVSAWYKLRYGHMPPHHGVAASAELDDEGDEWELAIEALAAALDELSGAVMASWDPAKHPRNPKGGAGGGRFRSMVDHLIDAIMDHRKGDGDGHPFDGFDREQLRRVAVKRGISLKRGESRDSIAQKLLDDLDDGKLAEKVAPKKSVDDHVRALESGSLEENRDYLRGLDESELRTLNRHYDNPDNGPKEDLIQRVLHRREIAQGEREKPFAQMGDALKKAPTKRAPAKKAAKLSDEEKARRAKIQEEGRARLGMETHEERVAVHRQTNKELTGTETPFKDAWDKGAKLAEPAAPGDIDIEINDLEDREASLISQARTAKKNGRPSEAATLTEEAKAIEARIEELKGRRGEQAVRESVARRIAERDYTHSGWVGLADVRDDLAAAGITDRAEQDDTLRAMARQSDVRIVAVADTKNVTDRDRKAALSIGGEPNYAIQIGGEPDSGGKRHPDMTPARTRRIAEIEGEIAQMRADRQHLHQWEWGEGDRKHVEHLQAELERLQRDPDYRVGDPVKAPDVSAPKARAPRKSKSRR